MAPNLPRLTVRTGVVAAVLAIAAATAPAGALPRAATATSEPVPVVELDGRGWGHGVGLSQYGARYLAEAGRTAGDILATFYPGTSLATLGGPVRVVVHTAAAGQAVVAFPDGGQVLSPRSGPPAAGFPVDVAPGGSVVITYDGAYHVAPVVTAQAAAAPARWEAPAQGCLPLVGCPTTTTPTMPTTEPPTTVEGDPTTTASTTPPGAGEPPPGPTSSEPIVAVAAAGGAVSVPARGNSYRGLVEASASTARSAWSTNSTSRRISPGWARCPANGRRRRCKPRPSRPARTALRAMETSGEICDNWACQYYVGVGRESAGQTAGVEATRGQVLTYDGRLASAMFSADAGGITAAPSEAWGSQDSPYPYLQPVRYDTPNPLPWHATVALTDIASRLGYPGSLTGVRVTATGPSGRATEVTLDGDRGSIAVPGRTFQLQLGLRSSLFTAAAAPRRPPPRRPPSTPPCRCRPTTPRPLAAAATPPARRLAITPRDDVDAGAPRSGGVPTALLGGAAAAAVAVLAANAAFGLHRRRRGLPWLVMR